MTGSGPVYKAVDRRLWTGVRHASLLAQLKALADLWQPRWVVVDATGVGAGVASFLEEALPGRVLPVRFSSVLKSRLGWGFLAVVETGRWKEWLPVEGKKHALYRLGEGEETAFSAPEGSSNPIYHPDEQELFYQQLRHCQMNILPGTGAAHALGRARGDTPRAHRRAGARRPGHLGSPVRAAGRPVLGQGKIRRAPAHGPIGWNGSGGMKIFNTNAANGRMMRIKTFFPCFSFLYFVSLGVLCVLRVKFFLFSTRITQMSGFHRFFYANQIFFSFLYFVPLGVLCVLRVKFFPFFNTDYADERISPIFLC